MKDIDFVLNILKDSEISQAKYASEIGAERQQVTNWKNGNGIPKDYILPTVSFLKKFAKKKVSSDQLLSIQLNDTATKL